LSEAKFVWFSTPLLRRLLLLVSGFGAGSFPAGTYPVRLGAAIGAGAGAIGVDVSGGTIVRYDQGTLQTLCLPTRQKVEVIMLTVILYLVGSVVISPGFVVVRHVSYD
jgi:hypothetical protein